MANIHYFPRYSQKENMVTNNTLLLFGRLYNNSPEKFRRFINEVFEYSGIELDTLVSFKQQEGCEKSIPDAIIEQESFKIVIETKLYGQEGINQIINHWESFEKEDKQIFLLIDNEPINKLYEQDIIARLNEYNNDKKTSIVFVSTTFKDICLSFNLSIEEYDLEMKSLIDDYENFCYESDLIHNIDSKVRVVLTGKTFDQNLESNIYYHPSNRGYRESKYIGLYKDKAVRAIGEPICCVDVLYDEQTDHMDIINIEYGELSDDMIISLKKVIKDARKEYGYNISEGHRFFFVDKYVLTKYRKKSKGGIMGTRYINLDEIEGYNENMKVDEIAELIKDIEWDIL